MGDGTTILLPGGSGTVAVSVWSDDATRALEDGETSLLSSVVGISFVGADGGGLGEAAHVDDGVTLEMRVSIATTSEDGSQDDDEVALHKAVLCTYWDVASSQWHTRGMYLEGFNVVAVSSREEAGNTSSSPGISVGVRCRSSHLTLFAVQDESAKATLVEAKIEQLASKFEVLNSVRGVVWCRCGAVGEFVGWLLGLGGWVVGGWRD